MIKKSDVEDRTGLEIAIIGMACRFPGAGDVDAFWENLRSGAESISLFSDEELQAAGVDPALLADPRYVRANAIVQDPEWFDPSFFGYSPREAELIDPQQRLFLECAWEALEDAGHSREMSPGPVGVFGGISPNTYLLNNLLPNRDLLDIVGGYQVVIGSDKDFLTSRVSYKLNLEGPSVVVQAACATSLLAVHLACQSLLSGECDLAVAGGVSVRFPQRAGYLYEEGGIFSPDGHCRTFDARARGTVGGEGVGVVVLRRLADALADRDHICAVIKGSAVNNDGGQKVGYAAPRIDGQAKVIRAAHAVAAVDAGTISYVEAHGTATAVGDPVEIAALTRAFRASTPTRGLCAIGSVKTNIGHPDAAAGVSGLIKTALALMHRQIPASLHFERPNPRIDFESSPFYVNTALHEWTEGSTPRRAGVSAFGIGGTNVHVVLEEAPPPEPPGPSRPWQVVVLSARSSTALETMTDNLVAHLKRHPGLALPDVAHTLQTGRWRFAHRRAVVCRDVEDAVWALASREPHRVLTAVEERADRAVAFMFPGQGAQSVNMAAGLYREEPVFRAELDRCADLLLPHLGLDVRHVLFPNADEAEAAAQHLGHPAAGQPALFAVEYALSRMWIAWGLRPRAVIGHSVGEYAAACVAGVMSLEDALAVVAARGRLVQGLPGGAMLAVFLAEDEVRDLLGPDLALAAHNRPDLCVISGSADAVGSLRRRLVDRGVECRELATSHAYHSAMMDPAIEPFVDAVRRVRLHPPAIPLVSTLTGTWAGAEVTDPAYWGRHLRETVRFAGGIAALRRDGEPILLEVGPGRTLSTLARHLDADAVVALTSVRHPGDPTPDDLHLLQTAGRLWLAGAPVDWAAFSAHEARRRVRLPAYPFERRRCWIEPGHPAGALAASRATAQPTPASSGDRPAWPASAGVPASGDGAPRERMGCVAPRDAIEQRLAAIWQEVLGIDRVGVRDRFVDLGGHSLLALRVLSRVERQFGRALPQSALSEDATVERLAESLRETPGDRVASPLVLIQPGAARRPLFCVHPAVGTVHAYADLALRLGPDQPVYGLQALARDDTRGAYSSLEEMAAHYVEAMRRVQPQGPYLLAGWSMGGIVAFEMARQLRGSGQEVAFLALLDAGVALLDQLQSEEQILVAALRALGLPADMVGLLPEPVRQAGIDDRLGWLLERATTAGAFPADIEPAHARRLIAALVGNLRLLRRYVPNTYEGKVTVFKAGVQDVDTDPAPGWDRLVSGGVEVHVVPGDHYTMLDPAHVSTLAGHLSSCLDAAHGLAPAGADAGSDGDAHRPTSAT